MRLPDDITRTRCKLVLSEVKLNCAKFAEMNQKCERFQTSAPGSSSWRLWAVKSGVWLEQVNDGPYAARGD